jgi:hypothetical protein
MDPILTSVLSVIAALVALGTPAVAFFKSRGENKNAAINAVSTAETAKAAIVKQIDERVSVQLTAAWTRIDELEVRLDEVEKRETRRSGAFTRILRAIAAQWPAGTPGPLLDPRDIAEVEETIPPQWIN